MNTQVQAYPSTVLKKLGWSFEGKVPNDNTPLREIDYYDVLVLEPTGTRPQRVVIIQITPEYGEVMGVSSDGLREFCQGHQLVKPDEATEVYYFDNAGEFGDQFSSVRLTCSKSGPNWEWGNEELSVKKLAAKVQVPPYILAEMLGAFD